MPSRTLTDEDPLTRAIAPPPNETAEERDARLLSEVAAKRISDAIDEEINRERVSKKSNKPVKILLLGQSESGKSTTLKNLQLMNSPKAFHTERASWRAVIQLNVVRSIRLILDAMTEFQAAYASVESRATTWRGGSPSAAASLPKLTPDHLKLKMRLSPLLQVEDVLTRKLRACGSPELAGGTPLAPLTQLPYADRRVPDEVVVSSTATWKGAFTRLLTNVRASLESDQGIEWGDPDDPGVVLNACGEDMVQLWRDPVIRRLLEVQKLRLEDMAGFFLDILDRVTAPRYIPSDDDILRARLKTMGVSEYCFSMKPGKVLTRSISHDWIVYDVGGQRSLVSAWVPFFDDMNAIIFLAPISAFDQVLTEDPSVNRLQDSIELWQSIAKNPLLKQTEIVLFLNKCDILKAKLASGISLARYIVSYADRPNDYESVTTYLKKKFAAIQREFSPVPRVFYCHLTSVTDMISTKHILNNVQDMIIRKNLKDVALLSN